MLRRSLKKRVARLLLRFSATGFGERVAEYVSVLNRLLHNDSGDIELNGENWLLQRLGTQELRVVLDVGANQGDWCARALRAAPAAQIHAFEPIPAVFARLEKALGNQPRATLVRAALTEPGSTSLRMWTAGEDGLMSSATAPARSNSEELLVDCMTGDDYLRSHSVTHVDLLKIDVEGHEMQVLRGFEDSFRSGCVDVVQFEFTLWTVIARQWLADYYEFFDRFGFAVGKLLPRRVAWKPYAPEDEQFFRCNFVAVRRGTRSAELLGVEQSIRKASNGEQSTRFWRRTGGPVGRPGPHGQRGRALADGLHPGRPSTTSSPTDTSPTRPTSPDSRLSATPQSISKTGTGQQAERRAAGYDPFRTA